MKYNIASKLENSKNYTSVRGAESKSMTFILGARCSDGVVLVADKKVSRADCSEYGYENKLFGVIRHVIFGASGSSEMFQLYRGMVMDYVNNHPGEITFRNAEYRLSLLAFELYKKYDFNRDYYYEVLAGIQPPDASSGLAYIRGNGIPRTIDGCITIGSGNPIAKVFMKKVWHPELSMEKVAELGYFIIKYIENFGLNLTIGVGHDGYPQIWFIPDDERDAGEKVDYEITPELRPDQFQRIRQNALRRLKRHEKDLKKLSD